MVTTLRAALAACMLLGFYLYSIGIAVALLVLTVSLASVLPGAAVGKLVLVALAVPFAVLVATWRVLRAGPPPPFGLELPPARAPQLWDEVRRIAAQVGTRTPDEIRLVPEVNAGVTEQARLLGLVGGRRYLYLGVPLLQGLTVSQLRAVLAHEMGHYSHRHTRLGALTYRGGDAMVQTIGQVGPTSFAGWLLRAYHRLYLLVSMAVKRRQEIEADRAMVRVAGRRAAASALAELPVMDSAWNFYLDNYVGWGLASGYAPTGVLAGFPVLMRARADELAEIRAAGPPADRSRWDSHPPTAERIALIQAEPDAPVPADDRPATALLPDPESLLEQTEQAVFRFDGRQPVPMEQYSAVAQRHQVQQETDRVLRAVARLTGQPPTLATLLQVIADGRGKELAAALFPDTPPEHLPERLRWTLELLFQLAAVDSGVAAWYHSWAGPIELRRADGQRLDLAEVATLAASPQTLPAALERLAALKIDPGAVRLVEQRAPLTGAMAVAGLVNVVVDGSRSDVIVLDRGLVVLPGVRRLKMRTAKRRMYELLAATPPEHLAALPGSRFVPAEEITGVGVRRLPRRYLLDLYGGGRLRLRWGAECEEVGEGWRALEALLAMAAAAGARTGDQAAPVAASRS